MALATTAFGQPKPVTRVPGQGGATGMNGISLAGPQPSGALGGVPTSGLYNLGNPTSYAKPPTTALALGAPKTANQAAPTNLGSGGGWQSHGTTSVPGTTIGASQPGVNQAGATAGAGATSLINAPPPGTAGTGVDLNHAFVPGTTSTYSGSGGGGGQGTPINGVDPVNVHVDQTLLDGTNPYRDAAYDLATRTLDPQWKAARASFEQDMVNRGFTPGSAAYDSAMANFDRSRNDAYSGARQQALTQGLQAQGQAFSQGQAQSQLANDLLKAQWQLAAADQGAGASIYAAQLNADNERARLAQQGSQFDQTFGAGQDAADWQRLMDLWNAGTGTINQNNQAQQGDYSRLSPLLSLIPGASNAPPIDVSSPFNNQYNGQVNAANAQNAQNNANNQAYAQWATTIASLFM